LLENLDVIAPRQFIVALLELLDTLYLQICRHALYLMQLVDHVKHTADVILGFQLVRAISILEPVERVHD